MSVDSPSRSVEARVDLLSATQRQDAEKLRNEMNGQIGSLRQEFGTALGSVKSEVMSEVRGVANAVSELSKNLGEKSRPQYMLLIALGGLMFTGLAAYASLASKSTDIAIGHLNQTSESIVPRKEIEMIEKSLDVWISRINLRVDRVNEHERESAIKAAIAMDRLERRTGVPVSEPVHTPAPLNEAPVEVK